MDHARWVNYAVIVAACLAVALLFCIGSAGGCCNFLLCGPRRTGNGNRDNPTLRIVEDGCYTLYGCDTDDDEEDGDEDVEEGRRDACKNNTITI